MSATANPQPTSPWNNPSWSGPPFWHPAGLGRPIAIAAIVFLLAAGHLGRILFWPIGLAALVFMVASGRGCRRRRWAQSNWGGPGQGPDNQANAWESCMPWGRGWRNWGWGGGDHNPNRDQTPPSSGNRAFDEYRTETLRRLEEEQKDFSSFLERLRFAKDKAEFDQFMAERRQAPRPPMVPDEPSAQN